jgi:hypothetical protein
MDTSLYVGPVANRLHGADLSFYVGFVVAAAVYAPLRRLADGRHRMSDGPGAADHPERWTEDVTPATPR